MAVGQVLDDRQRFLHRAAVPDLEQGIEHREPLEAGRHPSQVCRALLDPRLERLAVGGQDVRSPQRADQRPAGIHDGQVIGLRSRSALDRVVERVADLDDLQAPGHQVRCGRGRSRARRARIQPASPIPGSRVSWGSCRWRPSSRSSAIGAVGTSGSSHTHPRRLSGRGSEVGRPAASGRSRGPTPRRFRSGMRDRAGVSRRRMRSPV